ncbi:MAG: dimethyl sulfoxide reductase anchor subunit, partial [Akkermansiaceae bacterium]|nr:dimethyl sulfoxide reductase anchor subunit [Verrucomicrobiales bacterium]
MGDTTELNASEVRRGSDEDSSKTLIDQFLAEQSRLTAVEKFSQRHEQHALPAQEKYYRDLIPLAKPKSGEQYAFVVDLDQCSGCKACVCACHSLNGLDEGEMWRNVGLLVTAGTSGTQAEEQRSKGAKGNLIPSPLPICSSAPLPAYQQHVTTACHHCVEPGCADGCPVLAYEKDPVTGIVRHLDDQCIGCQYCVLKCPYEVPKYSAAKGIVRKCDMCHSRLAVGEAPACVQACPHEAIRIEIVDQAATRTAASTTEARLVPGAFESNYTIPTTRYESENRLPLNARPADAKALRLEDAHWPLVFMLILTQFAAGTHLLLSVLLVSGVTARLSILSYAAAGVLFLALNVSVTHLGRPLKAWRAFLGWRKSWMSREIIAFSVYAGLAGLLAVKPENVPVATLTAAAALVGVFCSAMIYIDTRRPAWSSRITFTKFFGTTLLLGATGGAVWAGWCEPKLAP